MSTPPAAAGRPTGDLAPRRPFQASGRFDRPVMPQEQIDALIRQARENAKRLMLDALQKTDPKYRSFIVAIGQWRKVGESGDRDIKIYVELPYMSVDGRVLMAIDEHMAHGRKLIIGSAEFRDDSVSSQKLCQVTVKAELRGEATGTARLFIGGGGANRDNPVETAETSAIGRALGFLGYGCFGTGIASADEMITALGGDPSRPEVTRNADGVQAAAGTRTPAATTASPAERTPPLGPQPRSPEAAALVTTADPMPRDPEVIPTVASDSEADGAGPLAAARELADARPTTSVPPAGGSQILLDALTASTLDRDRLAAAAATLLKVPESGYVAYLTRTFGVRGPESLSEAQLKKEIEFLLRRTQHADQAERFRIQCERLAQPAA
ncbi:MAG: hypothetical protein ACT4PE_14980 [Candidatus Eiseniibacteriota bacterium]